MDKDKQQSSWDNHIPKTNYSCQYMRPKQLLKVIQILKKLQIFTIKMKFGFISHAQYKKFQHLYHQQENDQYHRDTGYNNKSKIQVIKYLDKSTHHKPNEKTKKGSLFLTKSHIHSQIFLTAYKKQLKILQTKYDVQFSLYGQNIFIQNQNQIKSILNAQLIDMHKHLNIYIFHKQQQLYNIVVNSIQFRSNLAQLGIYYHQRKNLFNNVTFYSTIRNLQEIRNQVNKQRSYHPRVLNLFDNQLSRKDNLRIFDLVVKSIRTSIDRIQKIYQGGLQINKNNSCFVLHMKHPIFQQQLVSQISKIVCNLFIFSFPSRKSRSFCNLLKRDAKKYPFVTVNHYRNRSFICIDRTKLHSKQLLLFIFGQFLTNLNQQSKLTIHLKPNCILQKSYKPFFQSILNLIQQCKLDVQQYLKVQQFTKFNLVVIMKIFICKDRKKQRIYQFATFLIKLLILNPQYQTITFQQLHQILNKNENGNYQYLQKNGTNTPTSIRGNRQTKTTQHHQQKQILSPPHLSLPNQQKNQIKQQQKKQNDKNSKSKKKYQLKQSTSSTNTSPLSSHKQLKSIKITQLTYPYQTPQKLPQLNHELYQVQQRNRDKKLQVLLLSQFTITIRAYHLRINQTKFKHPLQHQHQLNKQQCYLVQNITQNNTIISQLNFKSFNLSLPKQHQYFIIYLSHDFKIWIPTHKIITY